MNAKQQAHAQVSHIVRALELESEGDAIYEIPLSAEVRSGWHSVGEDAGEPEEFRIVLCTGGPHVELTGDIGGTVRVVFKDWDGSGEYYPDADERAALDQFVSMLIGV